MKTIKQHILERLVLSKENNKLPFIKSLFRCDDDSIDGDYEMFGVISFEYNDKVYESICELYAFDNTMLNTRSCTLIMFANEEDTEELRKETKNSRLPYEVEKQLSKLTNLPDKITKAHVWTFDEYITDINDGGVGTCVNKDNVNEFIDWLKYFTEYTGKKFYSYSPSFYIK